MIGYHCFLLRSAAPSVLSASLSVLTWHAKTAVEQQRRAELHSACSLVLSTYARWVEDPQEYRFALLASIASAQLLCTPDSDIDKSIQELEKLVMITAHPSQQCGNCLNDFRQKAQQELINRYGNQRLPDMKKDMGQ
mgnify:CR=1 FL=1